MPNVANLPASPKQADVTAFRATNKWYPCGLTTNGVATLVLASTNYDTFLFAFPAWFPSGGTITDLGFYLSGDATAKGWLGVFTSIKDANGSPYPGNRLGSFESIPGSVDGNLLRSGSVSIPIQPGCLRWFVLQLNATTAASAANAASWPISIGGQDLTATASATANAQVGYGGWRTSAAATYNSALTTYPTVGTEPLVRTGAAVALLIGGGTSVNLPLSFYKFRQS